VLAKGPAAIILADGATGLWALTTRRWRVVLRLMHPLAIAAFCLSALPWYVLCARRNPDFLRVFILEHNFARFLTPVFQHVQPLWFFVPVILLGVLPWAVMFVPAIRAFFRNLRAPLLSQSPLWFTGCWAILPIIFFSLSKSKLPGYVLPSFPPLIFLLSRGFAHAKSNPRRSARWLIFAQAGIFLAIGIAAKILQSRVGGGLGLAPAPWKMHFIYAAIVGGIAIGSIGLWRSISSPLPSAVLMLLLALILMRGLTQLDPIYFSRDTAKFATTVYPAVVAENSFVYRVRRAQHYSLNFYLHRELPEWSPQQKPVLVFTPLKERRALEGLGLICNQRPEAITTSLIVCVRP
jgi:4-amino-4-deoxy-L-arabinose transferase-like glycosyltransferase